jgi:D-tyrosyl-tRNA(Tyr) deacylase
MRAVVQRVSRASVAIEGTIYSQIGRGLVVLLGVARGDTASDAERLASRIARLRIFSDEQGKFDRNVVEEAGAVLVVSQFTLIADTGKGNRPSFTEAAPPEEAQPVYEAFARALESAGTPVATGVFGARMEVALVNEGPVTIVLG